MNLFGKLLAIVGVILLLGAWQLPLLFSLTGQEERLIEEGGSLNYAFHLERDRMITTWVGASALILGLILYAGARVIARNEAERERESGSR